MEDLETKIQKSLACLEQLYAERQKIEQEKQQELDKILTPEMQAAMEAIEIQYAECVQETLQDINTIEAEVKADMLEHGKPVRGTSLQAVCRNGSVTWDTKALQEYAKESPETLQFRKQGNPTAFIRGVSNDKSGNR